MVASPEVPPRLTTFGYAVPGAVIGIGVLVSFAALDRSLEALGVPGGTGLVVTGSVIGLLASLRREVPRAGVPGGRREPSRRSLRR